MRRARWLAPALLVLGAGGLFAHVRLVHPSNGNPLFWSNPTVEVVIHDVGSDDVPDASDEAALRLAIDEWNAVVGTTAGLVEDTDPASRARADWTAADLHLLFFDETNVSGYFPGASGIVAITPIWFFGSGSISDADVIFNGNDHDFTTSSQAARFDVQDVATHELGHLLGLDHSAWAGATMYPYVDPTVILHRSLAEDEERGMRDAYPGGGFGQISGKIVRASNGSSVSGAHVVAVDAAGRTAGSVLSNGAGNFTLRGLDPGTYTVYAVPLGDGTGTGSDAPVDASNLTAFLTIQTDFEPTTYAAIATILATNSVGMGTLAVGDNVALNLGIESDRFPIRANAGSTTTVLLRGAGLLSPATLTASDPDLSISSPMWFGSQVTFQLTVPAGEPPGHVDLEVVNAFGERTILPAAVEITPPSPSLTAVAPGQGAGAGGTPVTITGTGFRPGARVVIGDRIYVDGVAGTAVLDPTTIELTTQPTVEGVHDVVVVDATGVEGRRVAAFQVLALPTIASVFPLGGDALGGTEVVISGQDFQPGLELRIGGVVQGPVTFEDSTRVRFTTLPGALGSHALELENPDGGLASSSFAYSAQTDPSLASVAPTSGKKPGGETITLTGTSFSMASAVLFEVDPLTGAGGVAAASVTWIDASTLEVVTPAFSTKGAKSVCVLDPTTMQASVLSSAFLVSGGGGGGGGGCYVVPYDGPSSARDGLDGLAWIAAVVALLALRARRAASWNARAA